MKAGRALAERYSLSGPMEFQPNLYTRALSCQQQDKEERVLTEAELSASSYFVFFAALATMRRQAGLT